MRAVYIAWFLCALIVTGIILAPLVILRGTVTNWYEFAAWWFIASIMGYHLSQYLSAIYRWLKKGKK